MSLFGLFKKRPAILDEDFGEMMPHSVHIDG